MLNIENEEPMGVGCCANQLDAWAAVRLIKPIGIRVVDISLGGMIDSDIDAVAVRTGFNES